ncbi:MAG: hypothetical protein M1813_007965 [Trichoglossum hirsutum]|nr:MAG: hypothetical protein M1813_007965 [Trichoglossum hirsutum]
MLSILLLIGWLATVDAQSATTVTVTLSGSFASATDGGLLLGPATPAINSTELPIPFSFNERRKVDLRVVLGIVIPFAIILVVWALLTSFQLRYHFQTERLKRLDRMNELPAVAELDAGHTTGGASPQLESDSFTSTSDTPVIGPDDVGPALSLASSTYERDFPTPPVRQPPRWATYRRERRRFPTLPMLP